MFDRCDLCIEIVRQPGAVFRCDYDTEDLSSSNLRVEYFRCPLVYVQGCNCGNHSNLRVEVSCITAERPYRSHPFRIYGKNCVDGVCWAPFHPIDGRVDLSDFGIERIMVHEMKQSLDARERRRVDPFGHGSDNARIDFSKFNRTRFRLCFRIVREDGSPLLHIDPVVSNEISINRVVSIGR